MGRLGEVKGVAGGRQQEGDSSRETELWDEKDFLLAATLFASFAVLYELAYVLTLEKLRASSADLRDYFTLTSSYQGCRICGSLAAGLPGTFFGRHFFLAGAFL